MFFMFTTPISIVMLRVGRGQRRNFSNFLFLTLGPFSRDFYSTEAYEHHLANEDEYFLNIAENEEGIRIEWDDEYGLILGLVIFTLMWALISDYLL